MLRRQPYSAEAEQAVLGSILIDPSCIAAVMDIASTEDFYVPENKKIFETLFYMFTQGYRIDPVILLDELKAREIYDDAGGRAYLYKLMEATPSAANVTAYAEIVRGKAKLRMLAEITGEAHERALNEAGEASELIESLEQQLFDLRGEKSRGLVPIRKAISESLEVINELYKNKGKLPGIPTGFSELDKYIMGLNNSDLVLLAARPGIGKTSIALNIARNAAERSGKNTAIFNLEMSRVQLVFRLLSSESMVDLKKIRTAELTDEEWDRLASATQRLSSLPLYIDDSSNISVAEIKARTRRMRNLGLVIIDYLQLIRGTRRDGNRVLEVAEISRALKIMAKELNIPVLCLSQLSRAPEQREGDKRPRLSDLRDSGAIEQDADIVMFLYRDDKPDADKNICECIIAKNRNGQTGSVPFQWHGQFTRFTTQDNVHEQYR